MGVESASGGASAARAGHRTGPGRNKEIWMTILEGTHFLVTQAQCSLVTGTGDLVSLESASVVGKITDEQ